MHDTEDPTRSSAADAAGMAADYSARHTYARGYDDGRKAEKARADAAERMVAELRGIVADVATWDPLMPGEARVLEDARAALTRTEGGAGRWCPVTERDAAIADRNRACDAREAAERARDEAIAERDDAIARAETLTFEVGAATRARGHMRGERDRALRARDEVRAKHDALRMEIVGAMTDAGVFMLGGDHDPCAPGEVRMHIRKLAAARDDLGIQYAAAQAEIARMRPVVEAARGVIERNTSIHGATDADLDGNPLLPRIDEALRARKVGG